MSRATPLVTCSLPVVYVCLSIRLETKPRGSIDGPTSSDKNLPRRPFITETNLFRFIILILSYSIRSFLTPVTGRVFPVCLLRWAMERGTIYLTRDYLILEYIRLWRIFEGKIRKIGNCDVTREMTRSKWNAKNSKGKIWQTKDICNKQVKLSTNEAMFSECHQNVFISIL